MKQSDIIQAWKSPAFRRSLSPELQARLPESPAGVIAVADDDLRSVSGGASETCCCTCAQMPSSLCTPCPPAYCF